jgi:hypothetical protein
VNGEGMCISRGVKFPGCRRRTDHVMARTQASCRWPRSDDALHNRKTRFVKACMRAADLSCCALKQTLVATELSASAPPPPANVAVGLQHARHGQVLSQQPPRRAAAELLKTTRQYSQHSRTVRLTTIDGAGWWRWLPCRAERALHKRQRPRALASLALLCAEGTSRMCSNLLRHRVVRHPCSGAGQARWADG